MGSPVRLHQWSPGEICVKEWISASYGLNYSIRGCGNLILLTYTHKSSPDSWRTTSFSFWFGFFLWLYNGLLGFRFHTVCALHQRRRLFPVRIQALAVLPPTGFCFRVFHSFISLTFVSTVVATFARQRVNVGASRFEITGSSFLGALCCVSHFTNFRKYVFV